MVSHKKQTKKQPKKNRHGLTRPKKAMTGYNLFIRRFIKEKGKAVQSTQDARQAIKEGASEWNRLSFEEKRRYEAMTYNDKIRYETEIKGYRMELKSLKCPRNSYSTFLRDFCSGQCGILTVKLGFRDIGVLSRAASTVWRGLTAWRKQNYKEEFQRLFAQYKQRRAGRSCQDNHDDQELRQNRHQLQDEDEQQEDEEEEDEELKLNYFRSSIRPPCASQMEDTENRMDGVEQESENSWRSRLRKRSSEPICYFPKSRSRVTKESR